MPFLKPLKSHYHKNKTKIYKNLFRIFLYLFITMLIVGFRIGYPYHYLLSVPFLLLSIKHVLFSPFLNAFLGTKSAVFIFLKKVFGKYGTYIFLVMGLGILIYISAQVLPSDQNPFKEMSDSEIESYVDESLNLSVLYLDQLEVDGNALLESGLLDNETLTLDELALLKANWDQFIQVTQDSEQMTDVHRYFGQISYWSLREAHTKSFVISYALYLKKFELFGKIIQAVGKNERVIKALNEYSVAFEGKNSYYDIRDRHVGKETLIRRSLGRAYLWFLEITVDSSQFGENYNAFIRESRQSYAYLITHSATTAGVMVSKFNDDVENGLFNSWFPIQKNVADTMGKIQVSSRKEPLISTEQITAMRDKLHPGDILIQRRNWHVSNVGIPGFWPHAALHLGTIHEANEFFGELFPRDGFASFSELVETQFPEFYLKYQLPDEAGYPYAVIEGQAPGIIIQSLEKSAGADYLGVLRPKISKESIMKAFLRAIGNYKKPYDYNFDFETRDEIVCSELVYDAYLPGKDKEGIHFELTRTSGRNMISPNQIVEKFYEEHDTSASELDFVYFIDGNENLKRAFVKDENAFLTSWTRSKFSNLQE